MKKILALLIIVLVSSTVLANEAHYSSNSRILYIPLAVLDGDVYYENVQILLDEGSGTFTILGGNEIAIPQGPYTIALAFDTFAQLITGHEVRYVNLINDSRCPIGVECITAGSVTINAYLIDDNEEVQNFSMTLSGSGTPNSVGVLVDGIYFRLLEVNPYPVFGEPATELSDTDIVVEYSLEPF